MLKTLATIYVLGFFVVGIFLTFSTEMSAAESMDIAAAWPHRLYKYVEFYFEVKSHQETTSFGK